MIRPSVAVAAVLLGASLLPTAAAAQFGTIFGDPPPRPPGNVPGRPPAQPQPWPPPQQQLPPPQTLPPPVQRQAPGGVQSQPLPPPPGATAAPAPQALPRPGQPPLPGLPPGQRQPRGQPGQPANTAPQPGDEVVVALPAQKIANPTAIFSGLDKITGRIITFDVAIDETVQFGALQVTPRVCYTRPPTETPNTDAFLEVDEITLKGEVRRIFTGWMFASSPGLHAVEHPIYDVWLVDCKGGAQEVAETPPKPAAPAPPAPRRPVAGTQQRAPRR